MARERLAPTVKLCAFAVLTSAVLFGQGQTGSGAGASGGGGAQTMGQQGAAPAASSSSGSGSASMTPGPQVNDQSFRGSVPQGQASDTPIPLTLVQAIERGLRANLGLLTNVEAGRESVAQRLRAISLLLPRVTGQISAVEQQLNLAAQGFNIKLPPSAGFSIPTIVPPYTYQSAQVNASFSLFDFAAISGFRSVKETVKASALNVKNARDLVVLGVGYGYLQIIADSARISATQAEIDADNAVYTNAVRRHDAGTAIGIDVLRSQVQLKQRQQTLIAVKNQFEKDKLALARVIGLPIGQDFTVTDPALLLPPDAVGLKAALGKAYENRSDYLAAKARVAAAEFTLRASKAERYPTLGVTGFYGDQGLKLFTNSHGVFNVTGSLQFNIFDGGRIKADVLESDSELRNRRNEMENLKGQIDSDVRNALLDLNSAAAQVDVARSNVDLSNETLKQAQDRFAAGVTNTVEVVQAQQSVADANENLISAQYQDNIAKVSLVRALGFAEQGMQSYFRQKP